MAFTAFDTESSLSPSDSDDLARSARWARITAIAGAIYLVLMLAALVMISVITYNNLTDMAPLLEAMGVAIGDPLWLVLLFSGLFFFALALFAMPVVFLFFFAQRMAAATRSGFQATAFSQGLRVQRNLYTYMAVLALLLMVGASIWTSSLTYYMLRPPTMPVPPLPPGIPSV